MSSEENKVNQDRAWNLAGDLLADLSPDDPDDTDGWGLAREQVATHLLRGMDARDEVVRLHCLLTKLRTIVCVIAPKDISDIAP
jgi:hypothetical protein